MLSRLLKKGALEKHIYTDPIKMRPETKVPTLIASTTIASSRCALVKSYFKAFQGKVHDRATDGTRTCKSKIGEYNKFFLFTEPYITKGNANICRPRSKPAQRGTEVLIKPMLYRAQWIGMHRPDQIKHL